MRVFNHDYAGYPFPCDLSRALAQRGHEVWHVYSASNPSPKGLLQRKPDDAPTLEFVPLRVSAPFQKWSYFRRRQQELEYARLIASQIEGRRPDVVLSGDTPTEVQRLILRACRRTGARFVAWVQDVYGVAVHRILRKRLPIVGALVGRWYIHLDRAILRQSDAIVLITDDFLSFTDECGVDRQRVRVIHNWAPLHSIPLLPKDNAWSRQHGLADKCCLVYSGTLGMKHNPKLLLEVAAHFRDNANVRLVVVSQGPQPDWLRQQAADQGLDNLIVTGWVPYEVVPQVLASSDVLLAILEPDAGVFSVPSKVLTYLCANRPMVLAVPPENLAARIVQRQGAGLVVPPDDVAGFVESVAKLVADPAERSAMAQRGRAYAKEHFNIDRITDRFEEVFCIAQA